MPPRKQRNPVMDDDFEELRKSIDFMTEEMSKVTQQLKTLTVLVSEVKQLKEIIKEKDRTIDQLEKRVQDLEQYTRKEDVIITGLKIKPRTFAKAVATGGIINEDAADEDLQTVERQLLDFLGTQKINVDSSEISACHMLPRKDRDGVKLDPAIIIRFVNRKNKTALMKQWKKLNGTNVYLNEHLTRKNAEIAREARFLKKKGKINATWTRDCKVLIRVNGPTPEQEKTVTVRELSDLDKYK